MKYIVAVVMSLLIPTMASAADLGNSRTVKEALPEVVSPFNWTGMYVGGFVGKSSSKAEVAAEDATPFDLKDDTFTGGVVLGYNRQFGRLVYGIEADLGLLGLSKHNNMHEVSGNAYGDFTGRVGLSFERWLVYAKGGLAVLDANTKHFNGTDTFKADKLLLGWTVGAGVEYALTNKWSIKTEYKYFEFDDLNLKAGGTAMDSAISSQSVVVGLNYKF